MLGTGFVSQELGHGLRRAVYNAVKLVLPLFKQA